MRAFLLASATLFLSPALLAAPAAPVAAANTPSAQLSALFHASDEEELKRNPLFALFRGDTRYADQFGDYVSDSYLAAEKAAAERDLAALARIDRTRLSPSEQVSYDVFRWTRENELAGFAPKLLRISKHLPIDHFNGLHAQVPDLFSGQSVARFRTVKDYEDNLKRIDGFAATLDRIQQRLEDGVRMKIVAPRIVSERVLDQLNGFVNGGVDAFPLMFPVQKFPESISPADQARLAAAYGAKISNEVMPRYVRMRDFFQSTYLPASRSNDRPGLVSLPGGEAYYAYLVRSQTTTSMTPEDIHQLGLSEVARIRGEMERVRQQVGFVGDLPAFFEHIRTDPRFKPASADALQKGYEAIGQRVAAHIPSLFSTVPRSALEIRPVPAYLEKDQAAAYYMPGTPDGSRPGVF